MKQENQPSANAARMVSVSGLAVFVLGYMLWEIVSAYFRGGSEAPTLGILIAAIVILGGGIVFALWIIFAKGRVFLPNREQVDTTDKSSD